jgi:hypothetical protein
MTYSRGVEGESFISRHPCPSSSSISQSSSGSGPRPQPKIRTHPASNFDLELAAVRSRDCILKAAGGKRSLSGDVRRRRLPCRSGKAVYWRAALPLGHATLLPQHDGAARIVTDDVERVLADIDADRGDCGIECLKHGVLLVLEHGRTIPF